MNTKIIIKLSENAKRELLSLVADEDLFEVIEDLFHAVETGQLTAIEATDILFCRMA